MKTILSASFITVAICLTLIAPARSAPGKKENNTLTRQMHGIYPALPLATWRLHLSTVNEDDRASTKLTLIANPVRHQVQARYYAEASYECRIIICGAGGKQILMLNRTVNQGQNFLKIDLHRSLPAGVYQLKICAEEVETCVQFIRQ